MRLVSLNVRYGTADDGPNAWEHRRDRLLAFLCGLDAGIICLQEVLAFQRYEIAEALSDYRSVGVGRDDGIAEGEFAPIFFRNQRVLSSGTMWLSVTPDVPGSMGWGARHARICTWAKFEGFTIGNLHLDHESEEARIHGVELVIRTLSADIVCGDFNAIPSESCIKAMKSAGFLDIGSNDGTYNGFDPNAVDPPKIDYVFARSPFAGSARVIKEPLVSDHWAVVAEIEREA